MHLVLINLKFMSNSKEASSLLDAQDVQNSMTEMRAIILSGEFSPEVADEVITASINEINGLVAGVISTFDSAVFANDLDYARYIAWSLLYGTAEVFTPPKVSAAQQKAAELNIDDPAILAQIQESYSHIFTAWVAYQKSYLETSLEEAKGRENTSLLK